MLADQCGGLEGLMIPIQRLTITPLLLVILEAKFLNS